MLGLVGVQGSWGLKEQMGSPRKVLHYRVEVLLGVFRWQALGCTGLCGLFMPTGSYIGISPMGVGGVHTLD